MDIARHEFNSDAAISQGALLEGGWDCIWVAFRSRRQAEPPADRVLQFLDWKLNGLVSRFILEEGYRRKETTFVPVLTGEFVPYIALEGAKAFDSDEFLKRCDGLKFKKVLLYVEDADQATTIAGGLKRLGEQNFPAQVTVGAPAK